MAEAFDELSIRISDDSNCVRQRRWLSCARLGLLTGPNSGRNVKKKSTKRAILKSRITVSDIKTSSSLKRTKPISTQSQTASGRNRSGSSAARPSSSVNRSSQHYQSIRHKDSAAVSAGSRNYSNLSSAADEKPKGRTDCKAAVEAARLRRSGREAVLAKEAAARRAEKENVKQKLSELRAKQLQILRKSVKRSNNLDKPDWVGVLDATNSPSQSSVPIVRHKLPPASAKPRTAVSSSAPALAEVTALTKEFREEILRATQDLRLSIPPRIVTDKSIQAEVVPELESPKETWVQFSHEQFYQKFPETEIPSGHIRLSLDPNECSLRKYKNGLGALDSMPCDFRSLITKRINVTVLMQQPSQTEQKKNLSLDSAMSNCNLGDFSSKMLTNEVEPLSRPSAELKNFSKDSLLLNCDDLSSPVASPKTSSRVKVSRQENSKSSVLMDSVEFSCQTDFERTVNSVDKEVLAVLSPNYCDRETSPFPFKSDSCSHSKSDEGALSPSNSRSKISDFCDVLQSNGADSKSGGYKVGRFSSEILLSNINDTNSSPTLGVPCSNLYYRETSPHSQSGSPLHGKSVKNSLPSNSDKKLSGKKLDFNSDEQQSKGSSKSDHSDSYKISRFSSDMLLAEFCDQKSSAEEGRNDSESKAPSGDINGENVSNKSDGNNSIDSSSKGDLRKEQPSSLKEALEKTDDQLSFVGLEKFKLNKSNLHISSASSPKSNGTSKSVCDQKPNRSEQKKRISSEKINDPLKAPSKLSRVQVEKSNAIKGHCIDISDGNHQLLGVKSSNDLSPKSIRDRSPRSFSYHSNSDGNWETLSHEEQRLSVRKANSYFPPRENKTSSSNIKTPEKRQQSSSIESALITSLRKNAHKLATSLPFQSSHLIDLSNSSLQKNLSRSELKFEEQLVAYGSSLSSRNTPELLSETSLEELDHPKRSKVMMQNVSDFSKYSIRMLQSLLEEEELRLQEKVHVNEMKKKILLQKICNDLTSLSHEKMNFKGKRNENEEILRKIKKKERGVMLKLRQDYDAADKMLKEEIEASKMRKIILKRQINALLMQKTAAKLNMSLKERHKHHSSRTLDDSTLGKRESTKSCQDVASSNFDLSGSAANQLAYWNTRMAHEERNLRHVERLISKHQASSPHCVDRGTSPPLFSANESAAFSGSKRASLDSKRRSMENLRKQFYEERMPLKVSVDRSCEVEVKKNDPGRRNSFVAIKVPLPSQNITYKRRKHSSGSEESAMNSFNDGSETSDLEIHASWLQEQLQRFEKKLQKLRQLQSCSNDQRITSLEQSILLQIAKYMSDIEEVKKNLMSSTKRARPQIKQPTESEWLRRRSFSAGDTCASYSSLGIHRSRDVSPIQHPSGKGKSRGGHSITSCDSIPQESKSEVPSVNVSTLVSGSVQNEASPVRTESNSTISKPKQANMKSVTSSANSSVTLTGSVTTEDKSVISSVNSRNGSTQVDTKSGISSFEDNADAIVESLESVVSSVHESVAESYETKLDSVHTDVNAEVLSVGELSPSIPEEIASNSVKSMQSESTTFPKEDEVSETSTIKEEDGDERLLTPLGIQNEGSINTEITEEVETIKDVSESVINSEVSSIQMELDVLEEEEIVSDICESIKEEKKEESINSELVHDVADLSVPVLQESATDSENSSFQEFSDLDVRSNQTVDSNMKESGIQLETIAIEELNKQSDPETIYEGSVQTEPDEDVKTPEDSYPGLSDPLADGGIEVQESISVEDKSVHLALNEVEIEESISTEDKESLPISEHLLSESSSNSFLTGNKNEDDDRQNSDPESVLSEIKSFKSQMESVESDIESPENDNDMLPEVIDNSMCSNVESVEGSVNSKIEEAAPSLEDNKSEVDSLQSEISVQPFDIASSIVIEDLKEFDEKSEVDLLIDNDKNIELVENIDACAESKLSSEEDDLKVSSNESEKEETSIPSDIKTVTDVDSVKSDESPLLLQENSETNILNQEVSDVLDICDTDSKVLPDKLEEFEKTFLVMHDPEESVEISEPLELGDEHLNDKDIKEESVTDLEPETESCKNVSNQETVEEIDEIEEVLPSCMDSESTNFQSGENELTDHAIESLGTKSDVEDVPDSSVEADRSVGEVLQSASQEAVSAALLSSLRAVGESTSEVSSPEKKEEVQPKWKGNLEEYRKIKEETPFLSALQRESVDAIARQLFVSSYDQAASVVISTVIRLLQASPRLETDQLSDDGQILNGCGSPQKEKIYFAKKVDSLWKDEEAQRVLAEKEKLRLQQIRIEKEIESLEAEALLRREVVPCKPPPPYMPRGRGRAAGETAAAAATALGLIWDNVLEPPPNWLPSTVAADSHMRAALWDMCMSLAVASHIPPPVPIWMQKPTTSQLTPLPRTRAELVASGTRTVAAALVWSEELGSSFGGRKRDRVDDILAAENAAEEAGWTDYAEDEARLKNAVAEAVLDDALASASAAIAAAFASVIKHRS